MMFFLAIAALLLTLICAGRLFQTLGKRQAARRIPVRGRYVNVNGRRMHVYETGTGPTVVLESGIASTSLAWTLVQTALSREARVISYDRCGYGWSDTARSPRTLENMVSDLHSLLDQCSARKPYILAGHSFGGLIVREFANRYSAEVSGLVLVDAVETRDWSPLSSSQRQRLMRGVALSRRGAVLAQFGIVRLALWMLTAGNRTLPRLISRWSAGRGVSVIEQLTYEVRKLPQEIWPIIAMHWSDEKCFRTMAEYLERLPANAAAAAANSWPQVPIIALTVPGTAAEFPEGTTHRLADHSGHWIQLDEPELVLKAIRDLIVKPAAHSSL